MPKRIAKVTDHAHVTLAEVRGLIQAIRDGVTIKVETQGEFTVMDFLMGRTNTLPIVLKIELDDK